MIAALVTIASLGTVHGTLVDRVVAVVDKQVITESELLVETRIALAQREGEQIAAADLDPKLLDKFLDYLIDQVLLSSQARRFGTQEIPEADIDKAVQQFANAFRSRESYQAFLRRFDIDEASLRNIMQRNLRNDRYIKERMRLRMLGETGELRDSPRYREALHKWLVELRNAAEIRRLGPTGELELVEPHHVSDGDE